MVKVQNNDELGAPGRGAGQVWGPGLANLTAGRFDTGEPETKYRGAGTGPGTGNSLKSRAQGDFKPGLSVGTR